MEQFTPNLLTLLLIFQKCSWPTLQKKHQFLKMEENQNSCRIRRNPFYHLTQNRDCSHFHRTAILSSGIFLFLRISSQMAKSEQKSLKRRQFIPTPPKKKKKGSMSENNESISDFFSYDFFIDFSIYSALFPTRSQPQHSVLSITGYSSLFLHINLNQTNLYNLLQCPVLQRLDPGLWLSPHECCHNTNRIYPISASHVLYLYTQAGFTDTIVCDQS